MRAARLAGSRSARNWEASCAVGRVPMTSKKARRRNTASEGRVAGGISRRVRRSNTRASMGDCADRAAALSKVGLRARSAPTATPAAVTARKIATGDKRIWRAEIVYRCNPLVGEKFWIWQAKAPAPPYATLGSLGSLGSDKSGEMLETRDFLGSDRFFAVRRISRLYKARWYMTWRRVSSRRRWAICGPAESSEKAAAMRGSSGPSGWAAVADSRR